MEGSVFSSIGSRLHISLIADLKITPLCDCVST